MTHVVSKKNLVQTHRWTRLLLSSMVASVLLSGPASADCLNIKETYSGTVDSGPDKIPYGPFTIGQDCLNTLIYVSVTASGAGTPPDVYIDQLSGSGWQAVAGPTHTMTSYTEIAKRGTYRIRQRSGTGSAKLFNGTVTYGH